MDNKLIAVCGIICSECDAYQATQAQDQAALERVAAAWREQFSPDITVDAVICDGCLASDGRRCSYCSECSIRACALDRGLSSCAYCADYACDILQEFFGHASELRETLDALRAEHLDTAAD